MRETTIETLTHEFVTQLDAHVTERINARLRDVLAIGLVGVPERERRPSLLIRVAQSPSAHRRKGPIQICPHPGCRSRSAPVFSMMCAKHKDDPRASIRKWREARRARKAQAKATR